MKVSPRFRNAESVRESSESRRPSLWLSTLAARDELTDEGAPTLRTGVVSRDELLPRVIELRILRKNDMAHMHN